MPGGDYARQDGTTSYPATVEDFCMDKYEVTVGRFQRFVDAYDTWIAGWANPAEGAGEHAPGKGTGWQTTWNSSLPASAAVFSDTSHLQCQSTYQTWGRSNDQLPINCVSWYEAFAFCIWDGGRLATEAEWEYAAGYGGRRKYPWGDAEPTNSYAVFDCQWDGSSGCAFNDIAVVGSVPNGNGFWGQSDLAGSMWEWVFDYYARPYAAECSNCAVVSGSDRVGRGGSYSNLATSLPAAYTRSGSPASHNYLIGVRCVRTR